MKKLSKYERDELDRKEGPQYDVGSAQLTKFRKVARQQGGVMQLDRFYRVQYAEAVETAVLAAQRAQLRRAAEPQPRANCASGTFHNTGDAIDKALRAKQAAKLAACPAQERRARQPAVWLKMYDQAMLEKREREDQARFAGYLNQTKKAA